MWILHRELLLLAPVLAEAGRFAGKRAGAPTHLLVDDESKADHFVVNREAPLHPVHANHPQADH